MICINSLFQSWDAKFSVLNDGRKLCLECLDSAIMDTDECQPLFLDIQEFFEGLNMKIKQQVPLLLVDKQALVKALYGEKHVRCAFSDYERMLASHYQFTPMKRYETSYGSVAFTLVYILSW